MRIDVNDEKKFVLIFLSNREREDMGKEELNNIYDMYAATHPGYTVTSVFSGKKPLADQVSALLLHNKNIEQKTNGKISEKNKMPVR